MRSSNVWVLLLLCLSMFSLAADAAGRGKAPIEPEWLQQKYEEGWKKVKPGILRRDAGGGKVETFAFGEEGYQWVIERYRQHLIEMESEYRQEPTEELASLIAQLMENIESLRAAALSAPAAELVSEGDDGCSHYRLTADAGPLDSAQGVQASASVDFESSCGVIGIPFAYAHARARTETLTDLKRWDDDKSGAQVTARISASAEGYLECFSEASASVTFSGFTYYLDPVENYDCPDKVSISGPSQVETDANGQPCTDVTWTANTWSGRTDYSFEWFLDGAFEGMGSTLTKRFCDETRDVAVRVTAQDGAGWSDEATFSTHIQHIGAVAVSISGPALVNADYYSSSSCATVTWTASADGGHPAFTYQWFDGSNPTVLGTGPTYSQQYCNANFTATPRVVVTDSDGRTARIPSRRRSGTVVPSPCR